MLYPHLLLILATIAHATNFDDYCAKRRTNLPCATHCEPNDECPATPAAPFTALDDTRRKHVLHLHNQLRNAFATGAIPGWNRTLDYMAAMSYSAELEFFAGCLLKRCEWSKDETFFDSRLRELGFVQREILDLAFYRDVHKNGSFLDLVFDEIVKSDALIREDRRYADPHVKIDAGADFVQIIWPESNSVGCAVYHRTRLPRRVQSYNFACFYRPIGNIPKPMNYDAKSCESTKNEYYPYLCGDIEDFQYDTYSAPINLNSAIVINLHLFLIFLRLTNSFYVN